MADFYLPKIKHWYSKWWGVTILVVLCVVFAALIAFALLAFNYWQMIKSGQGEMIKQRFYSEAAVEQETPEIKAAREALETSDDPYLGNINGELTIVEFMDFKCPICRGQMSELERVAGKYGYKVKVIVRDFPMESAHSGTSRLHEIASCANEQGLYWLFSDYFFANQDTLSSMTAEAINQLIDQFGGDKSKMNNCLETGRGRMEVSRDYTDGYKYGVKRGTPTFFVNGRIVGEGGAVPFETWEKLFINMRLAG